MKGSLHSLHQDMHNILPKRQSSEAEMNLDYKVTGYGSMQQDNNDKECKQIGYSVLHIQGKASQKLACMCWKLNIRHP